MAWRVYPYKYLLSRKTYEFQKYDLQGRIIEIPGMGKRIKRAKSLFYSKVRMQPVKEGPSNDLWNILIPEVQKSLALQKANRWRKKRSVVFSAICQASSHTRWNRLVWQILVQSGRCGARHGILFWPWVWEFMRQVPEFERNLVRSGIYLIKFWFSVSQDEQRRRFIDRRNPSIKAMETLPDR